MLTANAIMSAINEGSIVIEPFNRKQLQPNSYDVRLSPQLLMIKDRILDFKSPYTTEEVTIPESGLMLRPEELYLGVTVERTFSPLHVPTYEGRSTTGRYFLRSHQTAGFGDVGFNGHWTLEITVERRTVVYPYMRIGQIGFTTAEVEPNGVITGYNGNYQGSCVPVPGKPNNI